MAALPSARWLGDSAGPGRPAQDAPAGAEAVAAEDFARLDLQHKEAKLLELKATALEVHAQIDELNLLIAQASVVEFADADGDLVRLALEGTKVKEYVNGNLEVEDLREFLIDVQSRRRRYKDDRRGANFRPEEDLGRLQRKVSELFEAARQAASADKQLAARQLKPITKVAPDVEEAPDEAGVPTGEAQMMAGAFPDFGWGGRAQAEYVQEYLDAVGAPNTEAQMNAEAFPNYGWVDPAQAGYVQEMTRRAIANHQMHGHQGMYYQGVAPMDHNQAAGRYYAGVPPMDHIVPNPAAGRYYAGSIKGMQAGGFGCDEQPGWSREEKKKKKNRRGKSAGRKAGEERGPSEGKANRPNGRAVSWHSLREGVPIRSQEHPTGRPKEDAEMESWMDEVDQALYSQDTFAIQKVEEFIAYLLGDEMRPGGMIQCCFGSRKGSKLVQKIIQEKGEKVGTALAKELSGCVEQAWASEHANFVLSTIMEFGQNDAVTHIAQGLKGEKAVACARQRFGCRIIIKLIEYNKDLELTQEIIGDALVKVGELTKHAFGHHVVKAILDHGTPDQNNIIIEELLSDVGLHAEHRHASHVIESALDFQHQKDPVRSSQNRYRIALALAKEAMRFSRHQFAFYPIWKVLHSGDELMSDVREEEENAQTGDAARRELFEKSGVKSVCAAATFDWSPSQIVAELLANPEALADLRRPEPKPDPATWLNSGDGAKPQDKGDKPQKFGIRMIEALRQNGNLKHLDMMPSAGAGGADHRRRDSDCTENEAGD